MPYHSNIPLPGDAKSVSQGQILDNFTYLNDLVLGKNNFIILPEQAAAPATTATQMALYTKHVGAKPAMFLRELSSGTEVDFTTASKAASGWCRLPCGIVLLWFNVGSVTNGVTYNFPVMAPVLLPALTAVHSAQVTTVYIGVNLSFPVCYSSLTTTNITLATRNGAGDAGAKILVIGS